VTQIRWCGKWVHLAYIWIISHLSAKIYQNWCKFDEILTKTNLLSFFGTRCIAMVNLVNKEAGITGKHLYLVKKTSRCDSGNFWLMSMQWSILKVSASSCLYSFRFSETGIVAFSFCSAIGSLVSQPLQNNQISDWKGNITAYHRHQSNARCHWCW